MRTDEELKNAYQYFIMVSPQTYQDEIGEWFMYFGEPYYLREIHEWSVRESVDAPPKPVKIPKF